jgi:uroporphyrinogen-III synthase
VLRDAGASRVLVAASPDENAIFEVLHRAIPVKRRTTKSGKV